MLSIFGLTDDGTFHVVDFASGSCGRVDYHSDVEKKSTDGGRTDQTATISCLDAASQPAPVIVGHIDERDEEKRSNRLNYK